MLILLCFTLTIQKVNAENYGNYTGDTHIVKALTILNNVGASEVFNNLKENSVKIRFYDLSLIAPQYFNYYAINSVDNTGARYILINSKYKYAPSEQIACLIAHESFHKLPKATFKEEVTATQKEAYYWTILKRTDISYSNTSLTRRLDNLSSEYSASTIQNNKIENRIANNSVYKNQFNMN